MLIGQTQTITYRKTSNTSLGVQYKPGQSGVHLVPTYNTNSRFVWNNYDKNARICHTVSKVKVFVVYMQSRTLYTEKL